MNFTLPLDGSLADWGTFVVALTTFIGLATVWVKGIPERLRVANEAKALENADAESLREEMNALNKRARDDIHCLRNELAEVNARQTKCTKALAEAHAENRMYRDDMNTLLFLIRLLISEVKRLDKEPHNIIINQAEMILTELERKRTEGGNGAKHLVEVADEAVVAAEMSLDAAVVTRNEVEGGS